MRARLTRNATAQALLVAALAAVVALAWLGGRGVWDPDEGRYTNVALNMLDSGDWLNPHRNHEVAHWTKPPLAYWAIASSVGLLGHTPFAARLPSALAYLLVTWLAWRSARRLVPGGEAVAALAYATMLLPFASSQLITTDPFLAACQALAMYAFVEARLGSGTHPHRWLTLMWAGFGLGFLAKGPPALLPLLAAVAFDLLASPRGRHRLFHAVGLLAFLLLAAPWYIAVVHSNPGLLQYFIGDEVYNRIATDEFGRHGEWYGWLQVYLPTLVVGSLPWTPLLWRWLRGLPAAMRGWRHRDRRLADRAQLLLALWVLLPLAAFCVARSRLPLYLLPLFLPLALLVARQWQREALPAPQWRWLVPWAMVLLALKFAAAWIDTPKDAAAWAREIRARVPGPVSEVNSIDDVPRYGLHLELGAEVERVSLKPVAGARINPEWDEDLAKELAEREAGVVWLTPVRRFPEVRARIEALGYQVVALGTPYRERVIFRIEPPRGG